MSKEKQKKENKTPKNFGTIPPTLKYYQYYSIVLPTDVNNSITNKNNVGNSITCFVLVILLPTFFHFSDNFLYYQKIVGDNAPKPPRVGVRPKFVRVFYVFLCKNEP